MKCLKCGEQLLPTGVCSNLLCDYISEKVIQKENELTENE